MTERANLAGDPAWHDDAAAPRYRSSAAARMVNIPVATLRVWERRYQVVGPVQAPSGHRLYSSQDVRRLVLIKQLVDQGNGIGSLANVETARLQAMMDEVTGVVASVAHPESVFKSGGKVRVLLVGRSLTARHAQLVKMLDGVVLTAHIGEGSEGELAARGLQADVLLADVGPLHMDTVQWLWRVSRLVGAQQSIVVYGFAAKHVLEALRARAVVLRRAPLSPEELGGLLSEVIRDWLSLADVAPEVPKLAPPPRFDAAALDALTQAMPRVACECPQHLAQLVSLLSQFENYSADCETRQPADVALHAYLYRIAGQARALMEDALVTLAKAEGVALPASAVRGVPA
jgi:hypothetical protein